MISSTFGCPVVVMPSPTPPSHRSTLVAAARPVQLRHPPMSRSAPAPGSRPVRAVPLDVDRHQSGRRRHAGTHPPVARARRCDAVRSWSRGRAARRRARARRGRGSGCCSNRARACPIPSTRRRCRIRLEEPRHRLSSAAADRPARRPPPRRARLTRRTVPRARSAAGRPSRSRWTPSARSRTFCSSGTVGEAAFQPRVTSRDSSVTTLDDTGHPRQPGRGPRRSPRRSPPETTAGIRAPSTMWSTYSPRSASQKHSNACVACSTMILRARSALRGVADPLAELGELAQAAYPERGEQRAAAAGEDARPVAERPLRHLDENAVAVRVGLEPLQDPLRRGEPTSGRSRHAATRAHRA